MFFAFFVVGRAFVNVDIVEFYLTHNTFKFARHISMGAELLYYNTEYYRRGAETHQHIALTVFSLLEISCITFSLS